MRNFGSKGEKGNGGNIIIIFEEGETFKDRSTGRIFEVKKRTDEFVMKIELPWRSTPVGRLLKRPPLFNEAAHGKVARES